MTAGGGGAPHRRGDATAPAYRVTHECGKAGAAGRCPPGHARPCLPVTGGVQAGAPQRSTSAPYAPPTTLSGSVVLDAEYAERLQAPEDAVRLGPFQPEPVGQLDGPERHPAMPGRIL
jgi:hypothetical protein